MRASRDGGRVRGAGGDVLVGVTSIFASGARARVKSFMIYFSTMIMHHTIQEKEKSDLNEFGCARGPQCLSSDFFVFHGHAPCLVTDRVYDGHATHLATRPWGERASQIRARARADFFLFFPPSIEGGPVFLPKGHPPSPSPHTSPPPHLLPPLGPGGRGLCPEPL